jgi:hypothetical protein
MPTSVFFGKGTISEQRLYEDIVVESLKVYGQDLIYIPRVIVKDNVLNEVRTSAFYDAYAIEMYIENNTGFEGDQNILSKFGMEIRDQATFVVARRSWERFVGLFNNNVNSIRPLEGDLLYYPLSKSFFEIKFVEHEQPFYQLNNLVVYKLQCELFEYSDESFETGNVDVDAVQTYNAQATVVRVRAPLLDGREFVIGETIVQGLANDVFIFAEVVNVAVDNEDNNRRFLWLSNFTTNNKNYHELQLNTRIVGQSTRASWLVDRIYDIDDTDVMFANPQDPFAQNQEFEVNGDQVIDFTESNPFGDPSIRQGGSYFSPADSAYTDRAVYVVSATDIKVDSTSIRVDTI